MRHNSGRNVARQQAKDCVRLSMTPPFMTRAAPRLGSREGLSALTRPACCCSRPVEKLVPDGPPSKLAALACLSGWTGLVVNRRPTAEHHANRWPVELRSSDWRKTPPFTWEVADFVVVDTPEEQDTATTPPVPHGRTRE